MNSRKLHQTDIMLVLSTLMLVSMGLILIYSSSAILALGRYGDSYFFIKRQIIFVLLGLVALLFGFRLDRSLIQKASVPVMVLGLFLLVVVLVPGIGRVVGGARRWIYLAGIGFQPSEFVKVAFVLYCSDRLSRIKPGVHLLHRDLMPVLGICAVACGLLMAEPDFGSTMMMVLLGGVMLFFYGISIWNFVLPVALLMPLAWNFISQSAYRISAEWKFFWIPGRILRELDFR